MTRRYNARCTFKYWIGDHVTATKHNFTVIIETEDSAPDFDSLIKTQLRLYNFSRPEVQSYFVAEQTEEDTRTENKLYTIQCSFSYQFNEQATSIKSDYTLVLIRDNDNQLENEIIKRLVFNGYKNPKIRKYSITNVKVFTGDNNSFLDQSNIGITKFLTKCNIDTEEGRLEIIKEYGKEINLTEIPAIYKNIEENFKTFKDWFKQLELA